MNNRHIHLLLTASMAICLGLSCSAPADASSPIDTIYVSELYTTHVRFATKISYVDLGNRVILAKIVGEGKDLAIKAREPFDYFTTLSCLESDDKLQTYIIKYAASPKDLIVDTRVQKAVPAPSTPTTATANKKPSAVSIGGSNGSSTPNVSYYKPTYPSSSSTSKSSRVQRRLFHIGDSDYGIDIHCDDIYVRKDELFIAVSVKNSSGVSFQISAPRFSIESRKKAKRSLQMEKGIYPKSISGKDSVKPGATVQVIYTFDKLSLTNDQILRQYIYEDNGSRNFVLTYSTNDINKARRAR